jgi:hypothetical protein
MPPRKNIDAIYPISELPTAKIRVADKHDFQPLDATHYPYTNPAVDTTDAAIKKYGDPVLIPPITKNTNDNDKLILQLINKSISQLVADIKTTYLGADNQAVSVNVKKIVDALDLITNSTIGMKLLNDVGDRTPQKIGASTNNFKIIKDGTDGNKYKYLTDPVSNQDKFSTVKPTDLKTMYDTTKLPIPTTFTTLDDGINNPLAETNAASGGINTLKNAAEYDIKKDGTGKDRDPTVNEIQTRLNNCYTLELLYMRKHEELLKIFAFVLNLFDKYKYAIKLILYLLKSLVYRDIKYDNTPTVTGIKLPRALITQIGNMVDDQNQIQAVVDKIASETDKLSKPL